MIEKREWKEFQQNGLLWLVNRTLHVFGWAIVLEVDENKDVLNAYPARVKFRGFDELSETIGFEKISTYMIKNSADIYTEVCNKESDE